MKIYSLTPEVLAIADLSGGVHFSDSDATFSDSKKELENLDFTASYGLRYMFNDLIIVSPRYSITHKTYTEGAPSSNDGRTDLIHSLSLKLDYPLHDQVTVSLFGGYTKRDSEGGTTGLPFDFESADGGLALSLNASF